MQFHTHSEIPYYPFRITHDSNILMLGSCFSEHIAKRLQRLWFQVLNNPFGITYNPLSIVNQLKDIQSNRQILINELQHHQGIWSHPDFHGYYSDPSNETALNKMNRSINDAHTFYKYQPTFVFLSPGTAHIWIRNNQLINNCHKLPGHLFESNKLDLEKTKDHFYSFFKSQPIENQYVWTISPVRHMRQGFVENNRSKAILHLLVEALVTTFKNHHYFPSYELIMDDLRDYRFFDRDLIHPNDLAIDYVFEKFQQTYFSEETKKLIGEIDQLEKAKAHKALYPESTNHQNFIRRLNEQEAVLKAKLAR
jgi:hypothetical protein